MWCTNARFLIAEGVVWYAEKDAFYFRTGISLSQLALSLRFRPSVDVETTFFASKLVNAIDKRINRQDLPETG